VSESGETIEAFMYAIDKDGERLETFARNPNNNTDEAVANAERLRERVKSEFPFINTIIVKRSYEKTN
jgi:hypothetical protein